MKEYVFVMHSDWERFEEECNKKLQEGWTCQGGIAMTKTEEGDRVFAQAFVR